MLKSEYLSMGIVGGNDGGLPKVVFCRFGSVSKEKGKTCIRENVTVLIGIVCKVDVVIL